MGLIFIAHPTYLINVSTLQKWNKNRDNEELISRKQSKKLLRRYYFLKYNQSGFKLLLMSTSHLRWFHIKVNWVCRRMWWKNNADVLRSDHYFFDSWSYVPKGKTCSTIIVAYKICQLRSLICPKLINYKPIVL